MLIVMQHIRCLASICSVRQQHTVKQHTSSTQHEKRERERYREGSGATERERERRGREGARERGGEREGGGERERERVSLIAHS
jgi:hypothetical protein